MYDRASSSPETHIRCAPARRELPRWLPAFRVACAPCSLVCAESSCPPYPRASTRRKPFCSTSYYPCSLRKELSSLVSQHLQFRLAVALQHTPFVEGLDPHDCLVPRQNLLPVRLAHLIHHVVWDTRRGAQQSHVFGCVKYMRLPRFFGRQPKRVRQ